MHGVRTKNRGGLRTRLHILFFHVFELHMQWAVRSNARWLQNPPGTYMTFDYSNYIYIVQSTFPVVVHATFFTKYEKMYRCTINAGHIYTIIKPASDKWTDCLNCMCT